jgi:hypothetical protein
MSTESLFSDPEIGLPRWEAGRYTLELRSTPPGSDCDECLAQTDQHCAQFDANRLLAGGLDHAAYGGILMALVHPAVTRLLRRTPPSRGDDCWRISAREYALTRPVGHW